MNKIKNLNFLNKKYQVCIFKRTDEGLICELYKVPHICKIQTKSVRLVTLVIT
jgi:hypothetical protein